MSRRLIILDRDGVINHDSEDFVTSPDEWCPIDRSIDAIAGLSNAGFTVTIATNQSGIGRKLLDRPALAAMHVKLRDLVNEAGGHVDRIVYCPHLPEDGCGCRKPAPGLFEQLSRHYGVPLDVVPIVGDAERDLVAARAVNGRPILVLTGKGAQTAAGLKRSGESVETFTDLGAVATKLITELEDGFI